MCDELSGVVTALNAIVGAPTVLGSSYQYTVSEFAEPCVNCALLYPSGDVAFKNLTSYT